MPARVGCSIVDMGSGLHATIGILAALHQRGADGLESHATGALVQRSRWLDAVPPMH